MSLTPLDGINHSHFWVAFIAVMITLVGTFVVNNWLLADKKIDQQLPRLYETDDAEFRRTLSSLLGPPLVEGNRIETLLNGDAIFPAMLNDIRSARQTITFETYIYWSGAIGGQFADALVDRARAGVEVHVLLACAAGLDRQREDGRSDARLHEAGRH